MKALHRIELSPRIAALTARAVLGLPFTSLLIAVSAASGQTRARLAATPTPIAASAPTVVPALVPYSGIAPGTDGKPLSGDAAVTFLIFKDEQTGEPLWTETQSLTLDPTGHYTAQLGAANPNGLPPDLFATGEARWLEVQIAGQASQPRVLLASVPYALKASDAATLGGLPASAYALAGSKTAAAFPAVITPDSATDVTTTGGTTGYLPKFSGAATIVDSPIFVTSGGDVGIGTTTPTENFVVEGTTKHVGTTKLDGETTSVATVLLEATTAATATAGQPSQQLQLQGSAYNKTAGEAVPQTFAWQALPVNNDTSTASGVLDLLFATGTNTLAPTGLSVASNGVVTFAAGQKFPGTGAGTITGVIAGTDLTGGGTSGNVTLNLNLADTDARYGRLAASNTFSGNQTITGSLTTSGTDTAGTVTATGNVVGGANVISGGGLNADSKGSNTGTISPGLTFGPASGEGISSDRTSSSGNQYGLDFYTNFTPQMSISQSGLVKVGQISVDFEQLAVVANPGLAIDALGGFGAFLAAVGAGTFGIDGYGGSTDDSSGSTGGYGGYFIGGDADTASDAGYGLYAEGGDGKSTGVQYSADFQNDVLIDGNSVSDVSTTKIDHPADPANKYLNHAAVQSSELMNIYTGNVTTDELGVATVKLPDWFEAENTDFRYQLTVIGGRFAQAIVSKEIANKQFTISTNASNVKVSWQITAVRQDAYAKAHPLVVEEAKPAREVGFYRHPELFGQPKQKQTEWGRNPKMMARMEAQHAAIKARQASPGKPAGTQPQPAPAQSDSLVHPTAVRQPILN